MLGAIIIAMQNGIARGIFSNEAGLGSAPIAAAAAQTKEPVRQGLVSMTGTFLDTIVVCSMTGLALVMTGAYQIPGLARRRRHHGGVPERPAVHPRRSGVVRAHAVLGAVRLHYHPGSGTTMA